MELPGQACDTGGYTVTAEEAESAILDYLRDFPGELLPEWAVLNRLCTRGNRSQNRIERQFFLVVLNRLVREHKVVRYRRGLQRGKIRISEAFV